MCSSSPILDLVFLHKNWSMHVGLIANLPRILPQMVSVSLWTGYHLLRNLPRKGVYADCFSPTFCLRAYFVYLLIFVYEQSQQSENCMWIWCDCIYHYECFYQHGLSSGTSRDWWKSWKHVINLKKEMLFLSIYGFYFLKRLDDYKTSDCLGLLPFLERGLVPPAGTTENRTYWNALHIIGTVQYDA